MKILLLARHAKSYWEEASLSDHDRPLIKKRIKKTKKAARLLYAKTLEINKIHTSSALRAKDTAVMLAKGIQYPINKIVVDYDIYTSDAPDLVNYCKRFSDDYKTIMIVGHNPTFTDFFNLFSGEQIEKLGTSNIACIVFKTNNWSKISNCEILEHWIINPKINNSNLDSNFTLE